ncbi:MAG: hypothetical protein IJZ03_08695 [Clostridia bacterium]|nr:hypothetical protein [Clostridia bacterium]MBQ8743427.1 hypothetical protein [Clostridia bacterium]
MAKKVNISVNFSELTGKIKPMHGVGQPPSIGLNDVMYRYLTQAGIPYSRLHDVGGWLGGGLYVDIPNLFRDFDADENDPNSYDFTFTDKIVEGLMKANCEPYFRLGVTIENEHMRKAYRIYPPKDFAKWARICEHVIRHYNEGWANGYKFGIKYWEVWNEPDDCYKEETSAMWKGTPEQYYELYSVTAKHLKSCFGDSIKVGGYGHCGVYEFEKDRNLEGLDHEDSYIYDFVISFMHGFFKYQKATGAPIDFFSWHVYDHLHHSTKDNFLIIAEHASYVRRMLDKYGYTSAEHHLNEWNLWKNTKHRDAPRGAAKSLGFMLMMQNTSTDVMCIYDARIECSAYGPLFNPDTMYPYRTYYAFMMFDSIYKLGNAVSSKSDDPQVFVQAAVNNRKGTIVIANVNEQEVSLRLNISGFPTDDIQILRIDEENRYTLTGETLANEVLTLPENSCVEIKLLNI